MVIEIIACVIGLFISIFGAFLLFDVDTNSHIKRALCSTCALIGCIGAAIAGVLLIYFICMCFK